jgi:hypothetical protein
LTQLALCCCCFSQSLGLEQVGTGTVFLLQGNNTDDPDLQQKPILVAQLMPRGETPAKIAACKTRTAVENNMI